MASIGLRSDRLLGCCGNSVESCLQFLLIEHLLCAKHWARQRDHCSDSTGSPIVPVPVSEADTKVNIRYSGIAASALTVQVMGGERQGLGTGSAVGSGGDTEADTKKPARERVFLIGETAMRNAQVGGRWWGVDGWRVWGRTGGQKDGWARRVGSRGEPGSYVPAGEPSEAPGEGGPGFHFSDLSPGECDPQTRGPRHLLTRDPLSSSPPGPAPRWTELAPDQLFCPSCLCCSFPGGL